MLLLTVFFSCDPDSSGAKTYTTTVSGKIITPGRAADPSKGSTIGTAKVWADPAKKVAAKADGSYSLKVTHSGSFTLTADYTGADGNYKASAPQTVKTSQANYNQNIALKYGHTSTLTGDVMGRLGGAAPTSLSGATVVIKVEGIEVARDISKSGGNYKVIFNHPGRLTVRVNPPAGVSLRASALAPTTTDTHINQVFILL